jgi:hypothetical protein
MNMLIHDNIEPASLGVPLIMAKHIKNQTLFYYQKGSKGFGGGIKVIFDCTCWRGPGECATSAVQY